MERVARIELANKPWQGFRLPLHHTRIILFTIFVWSAGSDLNRRTTDLQSMPLGLFGICAFTAMLEPVAKGMKVNQFVR